MLGTRLTHTESGDVYEVVGQQGGAWVLQRLDFGGPPEAYSPAELSSLFEVEASVPQNPSDEDGWAALGKASRRAAVLAASGRIPKKPTPEEVFAAAAEAEDD